MAKNTERDTVDANGKGMVKAAPPEETPVNRPHETEKAVDPHIAQWAIRCITGFGAIYAMVIGGSILVGGRGRFAAPAYLIALHVPGAPWSWGIVILASGLLMTLGIATGRVRITAAGGFLATFWSLAFSLPFAAAVLENETANATGVWSYLFLAVVFMVIAGVNYVMRPVRLRRNRKG